MYLDVAAKGFAQQVLEGRPREDAVAEFVAIADGGLTAAGANWWIGDELAAQDMWGVWPRSMEFFEAGPPS